MTRAARLQRRRARHRVISVLVVALLVLGSCVVPYQLGFEPDSVPEGVSKVTALNKVETFTGRQARFVVQNADYRTVDAFEGSVWGEVTQAGQFQTIANRVNFVESVPLTIGLDFGATTAQRAQALQATVDGTNDFPYRYIAQLIRDAGFPNAIIRLGWEFDGDWMPWSAVGNEALWAQAYRHVVTLMRGQAPGFRFDWNGDPGYLVNETSAYPGDSYVDVVGQDLYDQGAPVGSDTNGWSDPQAAWASFVPKLNFAENFAVTHGKQVSLPEWGLSGYVAGRSPCVCVGGDDPTFVRGVFDWLTALPVSGPGSLAYHSYFNSDTDSVHRIDGGRFPVASALFQQLFGGKP